MLIIRPLFSPSARIAVAVLVLSTRSLLGADSAIASRAINEFGTRLLPGAMDPAENALLSPYSIQLALAMAYAGADGDTRTEMARVLGFPADDNSLHASFADLEKALREAAQASAKRAGAAKPEGGKREALQLRVANRLYGQKGAEFRTPFLELLRDVYRAPLEQVDFKTDAGSAARKINTWVGEQTAGRISNLIPAGVLDEYTRLVLVNALYFKAAWRDAFTKEATTPQPFHVRGAAATVDVPTMSRRGLMGLKDFSGFSAVTLPYEDSDLQFLVLVPSEVNGCAEVQRALTAELLAECAKLPVVEIDLFLPKFKMEPATIRLGEILQKLGLRSAFDLPAGSANFDRMAPRMPDDYFKISEVVHKAFISVDEAGAEAAAATAVVMAVPASVAAPRAEPRVVRVDRPFLFAIQHRPSGACLFLGRLTDPR